jgi:hypothetical protein
MKSFSLHRHEDLTGVSGTGVVAEGVLFNNGKVAIAWDPTKTKAEVVSVTIFDSIDDVKTLHGHDGATEIVWHELLLLEEKVWSAKEGDTVFLRFREPAHPDEYKRLVDIFKTKEADTGIHMIVLDSKIEIVNLQAGDGA